METAETRSKRNVALVYEHLAAEEIENLIKDPENVDDSSPPRHDDTSIPDTRLEPKSDKESLEVEIVQEKETETTKDTKVELDKDTTMVDVTNIVPPINVAVEEDEITDEVFELRRRVKGKNVEETRISPIPSPTRSLRNLSTLVSLDTKKHQELTQVKKEVPAQVRDQVPVYLAEGLILERKTTKEETERLISKAILQEIVARRANDCIVSITEPDYKNLNKNDIEDMYLLIMNNKVPDYANTGLLWSLSVFIRSSVIWERVHDFQLGIESYQQKINLTAPTITFPGIEEYDVFSIVYEPVHGIIYTNSKKEKRVMRPSEIHKFCDATLRRTLEGLKSYYNDVKYGYVQKELTNDEVEFLKLFEEEIEVRLNYRDQMRRWEMNIKSKIKYLTKQMNDAQFQKDKLLLKIEYARDGKPWDDICCDSNKGVDVLKSVKRRLSSPQNIEHFKME
ncbi:hypothetical protein Tco_0067377 [Tanacetum coccineum]